MKLMMSTKAGLIVIVAVGLCLLLSNIWGYSLYMLDEVKNAGCAREMYERADLVTPTFNQELRTDKPPLHYFFMMASYTLFGPSSFSARLFSGLFGLATVLLTWFFARKYFGERTANLTSLVLLSSIGFHFQFHLAVPDPYLIFFVTLAVLSFFEYWMEGKWPWLVSFYVSLGLSVLTKGPIGLLLPGLIALLFLIQQKALKWPSIVRLRPIIGLLIFAAVTLPWYWAVHVATDGAWTYGFFVGHNVERFQEPKEGHGGPFILIAAFYIATALPLSLYIIQAIVKAVKDRAQPLLAISVLMILVFVAFFSLASTKLPSYTSPTFAFTAIVLGYYLGTLRKEDVHRWPIVLAEILFLVVCLAAPIAFVVVLSQEASLAGMRWTSYLLAVLPVGASISAYFLYRKELIKAAYAKGIACAFTGLIVFYGIMPALDAANPAFHAIKELKDSERIVAYRRLNPAYVYHLERPIPLFKSVDSLGEATQPGTILITRKKYLDDLAPIDMEILSTPSDIFDGTTTVVARIK